MVNESNHQQDGGVARSGDYAAPERVKIEEASRITAGLGITNCDVLGTGQHGGLNPDDPDEPGE